MSVGPYIPVQPYIDDKGRLASLRRILGKEYDGSPHTYPALKPGERSLPLREIKKRMPADAPEYNELGMEGRWAVSQVSAAAAAQAGYGGMFTSKTEAFGDVLVADALAGYRCVKTATDGVPDPKDIVYGTFWGYSIRLVVKVSGLKADSELTLPAVAAKVKLGQASAEYSIEGIGGNLETFADILRALPTIGEFDMRTYSAITVAAKNVLAKLINRHLQAPDETPLLPIQVGVAIDSVPQDSLLEAKSLRFAMLCIRNGVPLAEALQFGEKEGAFATDRPQLSRAAIVKGYQMTIKEKYTDQVSEQHKRVAGEWLNVNV